MDAIISVICYKSKTLANGEHPLMLRIDTKWKKHNIKALKFPLLQSIGILIRMCPNQTIHIKT